MFAKNQGKGKWLVLTFSALAVGLLMAEPAFASGGDLFDRVSAINNKLPVVKTFMIYIAFLLGIGALIWAGTEMVKLSKADSRSDQATWSGVLLKGIAGAILVGLTLSSDTMQRSLFGTTTTMPPTSEYSAPYLPPRA